MKPLEERGWVSYKLAYLLCLAELGFVVKQLQGVKHVLHRHEGVSEVLLHREWFSYRSEEGTAGQRVVSYADASATYIVVHFKFKVRLF